MTDEIVPADQNDKKIDAEVSEKLSSIIQNIHDDISGKNSVKGIICDYLAKIDEVIFCIQTFIPVAGEIEQANKDKLTNDLAGLSKQITVDSNDFKKELVPFITVALDLLIQAEKIKKNIKVNQTSVLINSLFLNLFSIFDAYIGNLMFFIYTHKDCYFNAIEKSITAKEISNLKNLKEIFNHFIDKEIDSLRRESYVEQFIILESKFKLPLRKFPNWPLFVELTQRRNLIMHTDGIISSQYLSICKQEDHAVGDLKIKDRLAVDYDYLIKAISLFQEVGLKLGQTLWRKIFPDQLDKADSELINLSYDLLVVENWDLAKKVCEFGIGLPKMFNDSNKKILIINYAIALKFSGDTARAIETLDKTDFSSSIYDYKMANEVLRDNFTEALKYLKLIGAKGDHVNEEAYLRWPLFKEIRKDHRFGELFKDIYKKDFNQQIQHSVKQITNQTEYNKTEL